MTDLEIKMAECGIPSYMFDGISNYLTHAVEPGDFLRAVICNDLREAISRADDTNINLLPNYISFFYNYAPAGSWGSYHNFVSWLQLAKQGTDEKEKD